MMTVLLGHGCVKEPYCDIKVIDYKNFAESDVHVIECDAHNCHHIKVAENISIKQLFVKQRMMTVLF